MAGSGVLIGLIFDIRTASVWRPTRGRHGDAEPPAATTAGPLDLLGACAIQTLLSIRSARVGRNMAEFVAPLMTADDPGVMPAPLPRRGMTGERTDGDLLFRAVVEAAIDAIIVIDRSAIRSANRATERLFGYSLDELIGYNVNMLMPEPYAAEHDGYIANYLRTGRKKIIGIGCDVAGPAQDGAVFPMYLAVSETQIGGSASSSGSIATSATARRPS